MKFPIVILIALLLASSAMNAQPLINEDRSVLNAAGLIPPGLPGSGIAQGSMFVVKGTNLGPEELVGPVALPLPIELEGTSIAVTVNGTTVNAYIYYTWTNQVAAILPSQTPTGAGTFTLTYNGETSTPAPILVVAHAVGIFTRNTAGFGPAIVQNWFSPTDIRLNAFTEAAQPGQVETLWATGLGAIVGDDSGVPPVGNIDVDLEVLVGGKSAKVLYKGRSFSFPAIDQINFEVPADVEGCHVPVAVKADGVITNYASMAIATDGGVCSSPTSFAAADLQRTAVGQETSFGGIYLLRIDFASPSSPDEFVIQDVGTDFVRFDANSLLASLLPWSPPFPSLPYSLGVCTVEKNADNQLDSLVDPVLEDQIMSSGELDAGPLLNLTGPLGTIEMSGGGGQGYSTGIDDPFVELGQYTLENGNGGPDIGSFQAALNIPDSQFNWTNKQGIQSIRRTEDLTVTWSGGDPDKEFVAIVGWSAWDNRDGGDVVSTFVCTARPGSGSFTVSAGVLANLPVSSVSEGEDVLDDLYSGLIVGTMPTTDLNRFAAPGLDVGFFSYLVANGWLVPVE